MTVLELRGATAHNLASLDLDLPLGGWIALTGPSGSGKTTLAFDVLHREGQQRYLGALSARARHYLGKLGAAEVISLRGLPVTVATGTSASHPHPRSTVGTLTGMLDPLRLLFARAGAHPSGQRLSRSHFSFNRDVGACPACKGLGVEDEVHPPLLIADPSKSLREGALRPTLPNGYTVYSQVTLEVMDTLCRAHGFDVDTPWRELSEAQQHMIFYGTEVFKVLFGKHSIESRMKWEGITARPREEGYYRGLIPVIRETLKRDRNPNILRYVRSIACTECGGTRLGPVGRETRIGDATLPQLLALPVRELGPRLAELPPSPVLEALRPELNQRLQRMSHLALDHLSLSRESTSLSGGEAQRLGLAAQLNARLGGMLILLDEPTLGLHPSAQEGMAAVLRELVSLGNTLLVVDHDPHMVQRADHWLDLGPGAGPDGGRVQHNGPMPIGAMAYRYSSVRGPSQAAPVLHLRGASLHNLQDVDLSLALWGMTVVSGPSGAGKSSLLFETLLPALEGRPGGPFRQLDGVPEDLSVAWVDARPIGRTPRSTPATYTGLFDLVRKRFADTSDARERGLNASAFSYNAKDGQCPVCEGLGVQRVGLHLLQDVEQTCVSCGGSRYGAHVLQVRLRGRSIGEVLDLTVSEALDFFAEDPPILALCQALADLGLGYLHLGQASSTLSRGEAQRVRLAGLLSKPPRGTSLLLLDEPDRGLHPADVERLLRSLRGLVDAGHAVVAISHHPMLWQAADHRFALDEGRVVEPCPLPAPPPPPPRAPATAPSAITLRGVRTHNLQNLDVRFPHGSITAVTGVSGSGKSSLVFDTLAALAWSRFAESLPFQVRRFVRQQPAPDLDEADGLTPVIALQQGQGRPGARATVGTLMEIDAGLRLLWSRRGTVDSVPTDLSAAHFSANQSVGACPSCAGLGHELRCDPSLLITHPDRPLDGGAMAGTKPGLYLGEADGQFMATLRVAAAALGLEVDGPFSALSPAARDLALHGSGERIFEVDWHFSRGKRSGTHHFSGPWAGLLALAEHEARVRAKRKNAEEWSTPLAPAPCTGCDGERLSADSRAVRIGEWRLPALSRLPAQALLDELEAMLEDHPQDVVLRAILPPLLRRLETLCALGLGHLALDRACPTLSTGELQRLRLAEVLDSELCGVTLVLDEPGTGLHREAILDLAQRLQRFRNTGNTVVMVTHRQELVDCADHQLRLGPGAGPAGGRMLPPAQVAADLPHPEALAEHGWIHVRGAHQHRSRPIDISLPDRGLVAVTGPSGAGKSTLLFEVLGASAQAGRAMGCEELIGLEAFDELHLGRLLPPRSPLTALDLLRPIQALFHGVGSDLPRSAFSPHSTAGRCPSCSGSGLSRVPMDFMADILLPCETCGGRRFRDEVLAVKWKGMSVADLLERPVAELAPLLPKGPLARGAEAMGEVGLGHLSLGRHGHTLSGGEQQRLQLATALAGTTASRALFLLDEPGSGLHPDDLRRLAEVMHRLADRGALVVYSTHRIELVETAHWRVDLAGER